ncbi:MAG: acyl-CoA/acyl-ACP dehydrogenase [Actinomycetota bacterium]|nr:acyl-CoA/acyl-ACP dehydrogenase [Actinomycetota bacterium]
MGGGSEVLGPPPAVADDRFVRVAAALCADLLEPHAEQVDVDGVPRSHLESLAYAGLLGLAAPADIGGGEATPAVVREVTELLAGADGSTWLVAAQHASPLTMLTASANADLRAAWLPDLVRGGTLAGVAFSHLRRPGPVPVTARPTAHGYDVSGTVAWMTSWGLAEVFLLASVTPDDEIVWALLPARDETERVMSAPLRLAAMAGTGTVTLQLAGVRVREADIVSVEPLQSWRERDRQRTANATPAVFGLLRTVVRRLAAAAERRREPAGVALAERFASEAARLRAAAYRLVDDVPAAESLEERLEIRAAGLDLAVRASAALVAVGAGGSMALTAPAQRLAREALFHLVQAQTGPVRTATLRRLAGPG